MDNLNTHTPASFYEIFPPAQAHALACSLEIHYTPKHASWLNIAEIELSVLARQGLAHNIATIDELCQQVQSWQDHRTQREIHNVDARVQQALHATDDLSEGAAATRQHVGRAQHGLWCHTDVDAVERTTADGASGVLAMLLRFVTGIRC